MYCLKIRISTLLRERGEPYPGNNDLHAACEELVAARDALDEGKREKAKGHLNAAKRRVKDASRSKGASVGVRSP